MNKNSSFISHLSSLKRKTASFTLLELLIVVAIIAILAGILMPALSAALRKAKIISCTGNQKMIGLALSMYAADSKEYFPPVGYTSTLLLAHYWHRALLMGGYMGKAFQAESQTYDNDKRGKNVLICPEDTNPATMGSTAASARDFLSYGLSSSIATPKESSDYTSNYFHYIPRHRLVVGSKCGKTGCPNTKIWKGPQETFIATDSFGSSRVSCWQASNNSHLDPTNPKCSIAPRHVTGVPITFVDGHVNFWSYPFTNEQLNFECSAKH